MLRRNSLFRTVPVEQTDIKEEEIVKMASKSALQNIRTEFPAGTRVVLLKMDDPQAPPIGTHGTVRAVDDAGSLIVRWDNGCGLNVVFQEDIVQKIL